MGERAFQQMLTSADRGGMSRTEWRKQSLTANAQEKHKLANLSVFFEVQRSFFHRNSNICAALQSELARAKQRKKTESQISNCHFLLSTFYGGFIKWDP